ncbi:fatty acid desaturase family protein [Actinokineospora pegani]|uniref:fatty acid desaturase family protein n=1 Tax=Actinokineospora pegani TaxID=2654637 RepID=UPI0012EAABBC|nr:acyl-CoA desaturase [Actinokineospora pegani]
MSTLSSSFSPDRTEDFTALMREVRGSGLLERRRRYYAVRIGLNLVAFAAGWVAFFLLGDSWWQLLTAAFLAVMCAQLAFIGHDAGHKQIFRTHRANDLVGNLHGGLVGIGYQWWISKHVRHHANPNHEEDDPDLDIPLLAFSRSQAHTKSGFVRWTTKNQAFLFFPLLLLEGLNLHLAGFRAAMSGELRAPRRELLLLVAHVALYVTAVVLVLSPPLAIAFIAVHQGLWGVYMGCSFAPNHKGMPTVAPGTKLDFLTKQVMTSRNVKGGRVVDFMLGGLNYQIEHHLFPNMPRPNLRHAQVMVRAFCARNGIEYAQCGFMTSMGHVLRHLHEVGAPLRKAA